MRLIDADALWESVSEIKLPIGSNYGMFFVAFRLKEAFNAAPTIDAVPVVHGKWIWDGKKRAKCSICGEGIECKSEMMFILAHEKEHFCYNCGARMDLEDTDE